MATVAKENKTTLNGKVDKAILLVGLSKDVCCQIFDRIIRRK